ncbi:MAG: hypothetical protein RL754_255 [Bacteroidota bacterium]|jgi:hypothetical protein
MKPKELVSHLRENQNNNKTLKSLFASQFLGKLDVEELNGLKTSIDKEIEKRNQAVIDEKIAFLQSMGYSVNKG